MDTTSRHLPVTISRRSALARCGALASLLTIGVPGGALGQATPEPPRPAPNSFKLSGDGVEIAYASTSFDGRPTFALRETGVDLAFRGDELEVDRTFTLGELVSVKLDWVADAHTDYLTIVLPPINLPDSGSARFSTLGIRTRHLTTVGGPGMVEGAIVSYESISLEGIAELLHF
ncbi:MAG TPA: hypothetical protein VD789_02295 [Thermomicrobiales bacterium]|nr:hypothetical protein [Thermomicrobiales bacterium]